MQNHKDYRKDFRAGLEEIMETDIWKAELEKGPMLREHLEIMVEVHADMFDAMGESGWSMFPISDSAIICRCVDSSNCYDSEVGRCEFGGGSDGNSNPWRIRRRI